MTWLALALGGFGLSKVELALALAVGVVVAAHVSYILVPAWASYERLWERLVAAVLTLYMLVSLLAIGAALGLVVVWFYDRWA